MDENMIVELYWARQESAIEETQKALGPYLTKIAENVLGRGGEAEECVNDTLLAAWNAIPPARPRSLSSFLGHIVRQKAIDRLRAETRQKRRPSQGTLSLEELEECLPAGGGELEDSLALSGAIGDYIRSLSRDARIVFVGRYYYMDSPREIARYCGMTVGRVKGLLHRSRQGLREYLEKEGLM